MAEKNVPVIELNQGHKELHDFCTYRSDCVPHNDYNEDRKADLYDKLAPRL